MAECEHEAACIRIVEHHCPIRDLLKAFPIVARRRRSCLPGCWGGGPSGGGACVWVYRCVFTLNGGGMV